MVLTPSKGVPGQFDPCRAQRRRLVIQSAFPGPVERRAASEAAAGIMWNSTDFNAHSWCVVKDICVFCGALRVVWSGNDQEEDSERAV